MIKVFIEHDPKKGRGVFADQKIEKQQIIEECELLLMDLHEVGPTLEGYVYQYSKKLVALALGNGSLYNHSNQPNSRFYFNYRKKLLCIESLREIKSGEEITVDYGYTEEEKQKFNLIH
ncbi:SET domain-containing protein-lysine N-methyltransferase [Peredibacter starrii]|uniref:SET domain-containing protein-lysine N-methyltransferase n=1 Tax=Peredibacter starrii TaxID=28202 RepID=A0AAX4HLL6_9BACT|nr:SET domain-containing protein-lysine N-methyltransferase [Peredibacter starrii]WPU64121.1 SET domain-containing protein-lysine N-methyltransferase [Peredibacter starrii]